MVNTSDMFVVNLQRAAEGGISVQSCELCHNDFHNHVSFTKLPGLYAVFTSRLARELSTLVDECCDSESTVIKPDYAIDLPGLKLAGLRLLGSAMKDGGRQVVLRFRYFIGIFQDAFVLDLGLSRPTLPHKERIAIESLIDIVGPLYGLALLEDGPAMTNAEKAEVDRALSDLQGRAHALKFYSDLLIRYVRDCAEPAGARIPHEEVGAVARLRVVD